MPTDVHALLLRPHRVYLRSSQIFLQESRRAEENKRKKEKIPEALDSCAEQGRTQNLTVDHRQRQVGPLEFKAPAAHHACEFGQVG